MADAASEWVYQWHLMSKWTAIDSRRLPAERSRWKSYWSISQEIIVDITPPCHFFFPLAPWCPSREASITSLVLHYAILLQTRCSTRLLYAASQLIAAALCGDLTSLAPAPRHAPCMQPCTYHPTLRPRECRRDTLQDQVEIAKL